MSAQWWRDTSDLDQQQSVDDEMHLGDDDINIDQDSVLQHNPESDKSSTGKRKAGGSGADVTDNRGRVKNPDNWKVNVKKNARLRGETYVGGGGA